MLAALALVVSCRPAEPGSDVEAGAQSRYVLGEPRDVEIQGFDAETLRKDPYAARRAAWRLFLLVNQPVQLKDPRTEAPLPGPDGQTLALPLWQTWYGMDEFRALFVALRARLAPGTSDAPDLALVDQILRDHHKRVLADTYWTADGAEGSRLDRFIDSLDAVRDGRALGGVGHGQTLFSPALIKHMLLHYQDVLKCAAGPIVEQILVSDPQFGACLGGPFPANAIAVKANWIKIPDPVPTFDTGTLALATILQGQAGDWTKAGSVAAPETTYTAGKMQNLKKLGTYHLVGLSVTSKEIPEWLWSTFWWSPAPEGDFGADNPVRGSAQERGTVDLALGVRNHFVGLANYKMCTAAAFQAATIPTGATPPTPETEAVVNTLIALGGGASWCSNPYIEAQPGGANSNCIGCHQHAGPSRGDFEMSVGKQASRDRFPADFLWSFDSFKESFKDEIVRVMNEGVAP